MKDRAQRRQDRKRSLKKAIELTYTRFQNTWNSDEERLHWVYRTFKHPARCSCSMCGNPRRVAKGSLKLTLPERRKKLEAKD